MKERYEHKQETQTQREKFMKNTTGEDEECVSSSKLAF